MWIHVRGEWTCEYEYVWVAKNTDVGLMVHKETKTRGRRWQDWSVPRREKLPG